MAKPKILLQLDADPKPSAFDAVVAIDAGVDHLLQYAQVEPSDVEGLVHGALFTRGPQDLHQTAIFVGGSDVQAGQRLMEKVVATFFGPMRVSVMLDANGANTTAAAAVVAAAKHVALPKAVAVVLGGTGPVGQRVALLLARAGATVRVASRDQQRAQQVCDDLGRRVPKAKLQAVQAGSAEQNAGVVGDAVVLISAGAAGVELLSKPAWKQRTKLQVAIDLNAVPPLGVAGIEVSDRAKEREGVVCYGAIGVGGMKMKIHKAALQKLFSSNDQVLDAEEIHALGCELQNL